MHPALRAAAVVAGGLWLALLLAAIVALARYKTTPGARGAAPLTWPTATALAPRPGQSTLIMFLHPRCPCSRASLSELNIVMNRASDAASAIIVFLQPEGAGSSVEGGDIWRQAARVPGATLFIDRAGTEAALFGALTSGHVVLYGRDGGLRFEGGLTDSRGHEGDNVARRAILSELRTPTVSVAPAASHEVYGCALGDGLSPPATTQTPPP